MTISNRINLSKNDFARIGILIVWAICTFIFLQTQFSYHFFHEEQDQLFLFSSDYIQSYFSKPAWLACLAGDFLTQFYYYTYAGAAILTIALLCMGDIFCRCLNHATNASKRKLMPWVTFVIAIMFMGLCTYFSIDTTYKLSSIIAIIGGCLIWWAMDMPRLRFTARLICSAILSVVTYWLFGYGVILFVIFEIMSICTLSKSQALLRAVASLAVIIVVAVSVKTTSRYDFLTFSDSLLYPGVGQSIDYDKEKALEQCYTLDTEYYFCKYNNVLRAYEGYKGDKIEEMNFYYCLALEQLGMLPSHLTEMQDANLGTFLKINDQTPKYTIKMINDMYYMLGDMTYTERAALLANTFSPNGRNVRMIKRLAEANLVSGDTAAAMKYLRMLSKTLVYRKWARNHTPGTMTAEVKGEIERKHQFINKTDNIRIGDNCYIILTQLLDSNRDNSIALDYLLASDMLSHEREQYVSDYEKYGPSSRPIFAEIYKEASSTTQSNE